MEVELIATNYLTLTLDKANWNAALPLPLRDGDRRPVITVWGIRTGESAEWHIPNTEAFMTARITDDQLELMRLSNTLYDRLLVRIDW